MLREVTNPFASGRPGAPTGEEAYSIAILMLEEAERRGVRPNIQIFASDLDEGALGTAREGRFPRAIDADVSEERLDRYFLQELEPLSHPQGSPRSGPICASQCDEGSALHAHEPGQLPQSADLSRARVAAAAAGIVPLRARTGRFSIPRFGRERRCTDRAVHGSRA